MYSDSQMSCNYKSICSCHAVVALADTVGFCREDIKFPGPVHAYVVMPAGPPVSLMLYQYKQGHYL